MGTTTSSSQRISPAQAVAFALIVASVLALALPDTAAAETNLGVVPGQAADEAPEYGIAPSEPAIMADLVANPSARSRNRQLSDSAPSWFFSFGYWIGDHNKSEQESTNVGFMFGPSHGRNIFFYFTFSQETKDLPDPNYYVYFYFAGLAQEWTTDPTQELVYAFWLGGIGGIRYHHIEREGAEGPISLALSFHAAFHLYWKTFAPLLFGLELNPVHTIGVGTFENLSDGQPDPNGMYWGVRLRVGLRF